MRGFHKIDEEQIRHWKESGVYFWPNQVVSGWTSFCEMETPVEKNIYSQTTLKSESISKNAAVTC